MGEDESADVERRASMEDAADWKVSEESEALVVVVRRC